ncbi:MAG: polysaccharide deacetylase family protein [Alistipes sp.]|nr:polysaccharide deacetylase family protein [Alistipes sp.]
MFNKRIICIHSLSDDALPVVKFRKYISSMLKLGYKFVSLEEILDVKKQGKYLHISVDDGYKTCITELLPILEEYNIKATFFIAPLLLGLPANHPHLIDNNCYPKEATMTMEDMLLLHQCGHTIGYHTGTHVNLSTTENAKIAEDFVNGIEHLRSSGVEVAHFAYPFGFLPGDKSFFEQILKQSAINYAFTVKWGDVNIDNCYYVNRVCLGDHEPLIWSILKTIGAIDFYYNMKNK